MDQVASISGIEGHALLIDCRSLAVNPVPVPDGVEVVVIHSGEPRTLIGSAYAERRQQAEAAELVLGPLRDATTLGLEELDDPVVAARARHVMTENARVWAFVEALQGGWLEEAGQLMVASHDSLRDDYEVSTPVLDALVDRLMATPGVYGARLTGAGFGGCVVALTEPGALDEGWVVRPSAGARVEDA
jgi:galactokinase